MEVLEDAVVEVVRGFEIVDVTKRFEVSDVVKGFEAVETKGTVIAEVTVFGLATTVVLCVLIVPPPQEKAAERNSSRPKHNPRSPETARLAS